MNYKKWVYDDLSTYQYQKTAMVTIPEKLDALREKAEAIRIASYDSTHGGGPSAEELLAANIAERQELEHNLRAARHHVRAVERALEALAADERKAIEYCALYPQSGGVRRLQEEIGYEKSQAYAIRDRAIHHMALLLHGRAEL